MIDGQPPHPNLLPADLAYPLPVKVLVKALVAHVSRGSHLSLVSLSKAVRQQVHTFSQPAFISIEDFNKFHKAVHGKEGTQLYCLAPHTLSDTHSIRYEQISDMPCFSQIDTQKNQESEYPPTEAKPDVNT